MTKVFVVANLRQTKILEKKSKELPEFDFKFLPKKWSKKKPYVYSEKGNRTFQLYRLDLITPLLAPSNCEYICIDGVATYLVK